jgi:hypothetical protein
MATGLIIPENLMALSVAAAGAASQASSSMAASNLLTEEPSEYWRSAGVTPSHSYCYLYRADVASMRLNAVALVGHNFYNGDQYRIWTSSTLPGPLVTMYPPTGDVAGAISNTAVGYKGLEAGETLGTPGWAGVPTVTANAWSYGCSFATPIQPGSGADMQEFWIYVKKSSASNRPDPPTVSAALWESGAIRLGLGTRTIQSSTGQWMCFSWNVASLALTTAANVELKLTFTAAANGQYALLDRIFMSIDGYGSARANDSGWLTYSRTASSIDYVPELWHTRQSLLYQPPATVEDEYVVVQFRVNQSPLSWQIQNETLPTPQGYVQLGCVVIGQSWSPGTDRGHGPYLGTIDLSSKGMTDGGQVFGSRKPVIRTLVWPLGVLSKQEEFTVMDRLLRRHGILKKFFVHLAPGDTYEGEIAGFMATLKNAEHTSSTTPATEGNRALTLEFVEAL